MLCVCVNKGSISHVRHSPPWAQTSKGGLPWFTDRGWCGRYRVKARLAGSSPSSGIFLDLSGYHREEVKQHWEEIKELRRLASKEKTIPSGIADFQLLQFLHSVRYNVGAAHHTLRVNYKTKQEFPNLYSLRNPYAPDIQKAWTVVNMFSMPDTTEKGFKILYCGFLNPDPEEFDVLATMKLFTMAVEATLMTEGLYSGYVVLLDAKGVTLRHCPFSALPLIKKFVLFIQEGLPINITEIHILNASPIVEKIFNFVKPFLRKELLHIIMFHQTGRNSLNSRVPARYLHKELGGSLLPAAHYQNSEMPEIEKSWWTLPLEKQIQEDKNIKREDINAIKEWLAKQPHLPQLPDEQLSVFLVSCGYSMETTKRVIDLNYTLRTRHPRIFADRFLGSPDLRHMKDLVKFGIPPHKKGRPVVLTYGLKPMDISHFSFEATVKLAFMLQDVSHLRIGPVPEGYIYLFDMQDVTLGHVLRIPLAVCASVLKYAQEASCCKIAGIHIMNANSILETLLNLLKPFLQPEIWNMITPHEKTTGLLKYLEPQEIPREFDDGEGPNFEELTEEFLKLMEEYKDWFKQEESLRVVEEKRPAGSSSSLDVGGVQGSFRKLELD